MSDGSCPGGTGDDTTTALQESRGDRQVQGQRRQLLIFLNRVRVEAYRGGKRKSGVGFGAGEINATTVSPNHAKRGCAAVVCEGCDRVLPWTESATGLNCGIRCAEAGNDVAVTRWNSWCVS